MNGIKIIYLTAVAVIATATGAAAQEFRTDINPALRYYEAFLLEPKLSPTDHDYVFTNEWRGQKLPPRFGELIAGFHNSFEMMCEAGQATAPCDWGIDLSAGAETLLPHLARCRALAQAASLQAVWDLQVGKESEARDNLLGAYALGRNSSRDGTLIAALVQIAIENIVISTVAENFHSFSTETLQQLVDGFDAAPAQGTMAYAMVTGEQSFFSGWMDRKIIKWQGENPGNDAKVMANLHALFLTMGDESGSNPWASVLTNIKTSDDVLKFVRDGSATCQKAAEIMALPHPAFEGKAAQFQKDIDEGPNPLVKLTMPSILKARQKEFMAQAILAMFHAAVAYKTHGEQGFRAVSDPFGDGPFHFDRFIFDGSDRGFRLTSAYAGRGYPESLIFVESDGPAFVCFGPKVGEPVSVSK